MGVAVEGEDLVRRRVVNDRIRILGGVHAPEHAEGLEIEHEDRAILTGGREPMIRFWRQGRAVRALDASHLAEQLSRLLIDHHDPILAPDEEAMCRGVRYDVIPRAVAS